MRPRIVVMDARRAKVQRVRDAVEVLYRNTCTRFPRFRTMDDSGRSFGWLFSEDKLRNTPSVQSGISHVQELVFRQKQAMLMQALGQKSGLTQLAINTSVVFMHRFYMFRTVKHFPRIHVVIGFVFAAGKVEESARKLEHLIRTTIDILRHNKNGEFLDKRDKLTYEMDCEWRERIETLRQNNCNVESAAYLEMRRTVLECEAEIYAVIGFQLQIVHPHNFVIRMCALLGAEHIKDISQYAYNLATASSQLTMLCLKYKPELIATVCLNIAAKAHSVKFMCMKDSAVQWYQVYDQTMDIKEIESVSEEFLSLIKSCQLLPSWMTSLARAPRSNPRSLPGSKGMPSSSSQGHHNRPHQLSSSSASLPSSSQSRDPSKIPPMSMPSSHPEQQSSHTSSASGAVDSAPSNGSHHRSGPAEGNSGAPENPMKESHSSHSQMMGSVKPSSSVPGGSSGVPLPRSQSFTNPHPAQLQHRSHPGSGYSSSDRLTSSQPPASVPATASASSSSRPMPNPQQPRHSSLLPSSRPHPGSSTSHPTSSSSSRPRFDPNRPDGAYRSDASDARRSSRPMPPPDDANRNSHPRPADHLLSQRQLEPSTHTPPPKPPTTSPVVKPPSPLLQTPDTALAPGAGDMSMQAGDVSQAQDNMTIPQLRGSASSSRLSLSTYRERNRSRPVPPTANESMSEDSGIGGAGTSEDASCQKDSSTMDSPAAPAGLKPCASAPELSSAAQDSPTNPRIKIKVKRDPTSGERHSVKYADSGLKIKIKPPRMDPVEGEAGPSTSRSSTPMEEGEVVDSPNSTPSGDRKMEGGLKIRLPVPRSGESSSYSRSNDQMNGYGEHRSHHHGHHHRSHHSHKSKKHSSKHSSSRHERSSKRPSSSNDLDERPAKSSRTDYPSQTASASGEMLRTYVDLGPRFEPSRSLQHQNSGFSINDAFSSTLPSNIFDEDDDMSHVPPPVTPTPDAVPPHHEKFHLLMSKHRAQMMENPPLPPLPSDTFPPPPPPPPPTSPPPPPSL